MKLKMKWQSLNKKQKIFIILGAILIPTMVLGIKGLKYLLSIHGYEIVLNKTSSLPGAFWVINQNKKTAFKRGDYFAFYAPNNKMLSHPDVPLLKMVKAVSGQSVSFKNHHVYIDDKDAGIVWSKTENGYTLTPIESQIIQKDCYFAWTPAMYSYDSRYEDVGIVCEKEHRIVGSAFLLF